ncbi:MAG: F-type H+-transporting ATPase subunit gamma [Cryomorphaceae bacterium]|jgi:F-type H+-transporting ATPase subunit gamma
MVMSDTTASLQQKISSAGDLQSVVRTMKALAASSIGQYEQSVRALADYYRTVELGLSVCLRQREEASGTLRNSAQNNVCTVSAIIFGSDQGLVGQFNDIIADYTINTLAALPGKPQIWAVGERVHARLIDAGLPVAGKFLVPNSVKAITPLVIQIQIQSQMQRTTSGDEEVYIFHNRPQPGSLYKPISQRLLPLDEVWRQSLVKIAWPKKIDPQVVNDLSSTMRPLIREYLFISLYRACAESLASENASRLSAMQRADKNINELLEDLKSAFHHLRQSSIDEELFDVVSGYEALGGSI